MNWLWSSLVLLAFGGWVGWLVWRDRRWRHDVNEWLRRPVREPDPVLRKINRRWRAWR